MRYRPWSNKDLKTLKKEYPVTPDPKALAKKLGRKYAAMKTRANKMGLKRKFIASDPWHDKMLVTKLKKLYPNNANREIAEMLGVTESAVGARAFKLGLRKTEQFMRERSSVTCFKKGHTPFNKGMKLSDFMSAEAIKKSAKYRFKKGQLPHNTKEKDGVIVIRNGHPNRKERPSKWIRIGLGRWKELSRYKWEKKYGKIPRGMIITFKDGDPLNCTLKNMKMISRKENMTRNSSSVNIKDGFIANALSRRKGGIGLYDMEAREAYLQDKELLELKRAQILLQRTIKSKSDVKERKPNDNRPQKPSVRADRKIK